MIVKLYIADHIFIVIAEVITIEITISILIHGGKHERLGWIDKNHLEVINIQQNDRERLELILGIL